jgi:hypothetical protein
MELDEMEAELNAHTATPRSPDSGDESNPDSAEESNSDSEDEPSYASSDDDNDGNSNAGPEHDEGDAQDDPGPSEEELPENDTATQDAEHQAATLEQEIPAQDSQQADGVVTLSNQRQVPYKLVQGKKRVIGQPKPEPKPTTTLHGLTISQLVDHILRLTTEPETEEQRAARVEREAYETKVFLARIPYLDMCERIEKAEKKRKDKEQIRESIKRIQQMNQEARAEGMRKLEEYNAQRKAEDAEKERQKQLMDPHNRVPAWTKNITKYVQSGYIKLQPLPADYQQAGSAQRRTADTDGDYDNVTPPMSDAKSATDGDGKSSKRSLSHRDRHARDERNRQSSRSSRYGSTSERSTSYYASERDRNEGRDRRGRRT